MTFNDLTLTTNDLSLTFNDLSMTFNDLSMTFNDLSMTFNEFIFVMNIKLLRCISFQFSKFYKYSNSSEWWSLRIVLHIIILIFEKSDINIFWWSKKINPSKSSQLTIPPIKYSERRSETMFRHPQTYFRHSRYSCPETIVWGNRIDPAYHIWGVLWAIPCGVGSSGGRWTRIGGDKLLFFKMLTVPRYSSFFDSLQRHVF